MKQSQRTAAYSHIRRQITAGIFPPGQRLSPARIAREIGVSHVPVREAISLLTSEGLVVSHAFRGAFVRAIDRNELVELIEMRTVLECHTAVQAAKKISAAQLQTLDERFQDLRRLAKAFRVPPGTDLHNQLRDWLLGDLAFHVALLLTAANRPIMRVLDETRVMTHMFAYRTDHPGAWADPAGFATKNLAVHQAVYEAVRRRDPKAAQRAMMAHMRLASENILARYDWLSREDRTESSPGTEFSDSMRELVNSIQHDLPDRPQDSSERPRPTRRTTS